MCLCEAVDGSEIYSFPLLHSLTASPLIPRQLFFLITFCCPRIRSPSKAKALKLFPRLWFPSIQAKIIILDSLLLTYLQCLLYHKSSFSKCVCFKCVYFVPLIYLCSFTDTTHFKFYHIAPKLNHLQVIWGHNIL